MSWVVDSRDLLAEARAWLTSRVGYRPDASSVADQMVETGAMIAQEIFDVLGTDVLPGIEVALLERDGFVYVTASSARATLTVTADTIGPHTLAAGETVRAGGIDWALSAPLTVLPGATSGTGEVVAVDPGAAPNSITTAAAVTNTTTSWVEAASLTLTQTGTDTETADQYLQRGRKLRRISSPQLILPQDYADYIEIFVTGVARAAVYDGYNPADGSTGNERMNAVCAINAQGEPVGSVISAAAKAAMQARRESSFKVNMVDPTYTTVSSAFSFTTMPGYSPADVGQRARDAVRDELSPARHGLPRTNDEPLWRRVTTIYRRELETVAQLVDGLDRITDFTLNGGSADVTLAGAFPLPRPGTITATPA